MVFRSFLSGVDNHCHVRLSHAIFLSSSFCNTPATEGTNEGCAPQA